MELHFHTTHEGWEIWVKLGSPSPRLWHPHHLLEAMPGSRVLVPQALRMLCRVLVQGNVLYSKIISHLCSMCTSKLLPLCQTHPPLWFKTLANLNQKEKKTTSNPNSPSCSETPSLFENSIYTNRTQLTNVTKLRSLQRGEG